MQQQRSKRPPAETAKPLTEVVSQVFDDSGAPCDSCVFMRTGDDLAEVVSQTMPKRRKPDKPERAPIAKP
jgi:hypothetical protein